MADSPAVRFVVFRVGDLVCAVPVEVVREIISPQPATRIPGAPSTIDGLVNVRGSLLTVVKGHAVLGREAPGGDGGSVLVLEVAGRALGFEVDEVLDLLQVSPGALDPRESLPGIDPRLVKAVGRQGKRIFVLLDTEALLAPLLGG
ncbi:MAG: chemotaxis protein CheW [Gemmatimonadales bacterium]